jgi:hypothetical protein
LQASSCAPGLGVRATDDRSPGRKVAVLDSVLDSPHPAFGRPLPGGEGERWETLRTRGSNGNGAMGWTGSPRIRAARAAWRFRAICLDCGVAIALTAATAATGKKFLDFLTLGMPKFTKLGAYSNSVSMTATGVGAGHHHHHLSLPIQGMPVSLGPGLRTARQSGEFLSGSAKKCQKVP